MELKEIKELFKAFDESGSSYFVLEQDGVKIKLKKDMIFSVEKRFINGYIIIIIIYYTF